MLSIRTEIAVGARSAQGFGKLCTNEKPGFLILKRTLCDAGPQCPGPGRCTIYFALMNATAVSSMRLLNPHSLSYQADTFTSVPFDTLVSVESNMLECGL